MSAPSQTITEVAPGERIAAALLSCLISVCLAPLGARPVAEATLLPVGLTAVVALFALWAPRAFERSSPVRIPAYAPGR